EPLPGDVAEREAGVQALQPTVVLGPEKGERRDEGSGAHAGDELEDGPLSRLRPAVQDARPECSAVAAAGAREERRRRQGGFRGKSERGPFAVERGENVSL